MTPNKIAKWILDLEARRDSKGRLVVYKLPAGDGGGRFEVAGINERYHPKMANRLAKLLRDHKYKQAEKEATKYIEEYTDDVEDWSKLMSLQAFFRDSMFNRGIRGAAAILQLALRRMGNDLVVDGRVGPLTRAALENSDEDQERLILNLRASREYYERNSYPWKPNKRDETSKFWRGLVNRWNKARDFSLSLI